MKRIKKQRRGWRYLICYSGCFLVIALLIYSVFYWNGKTFVWTSYGIPQHFNALVYYRSWLREILRNLFVEHRLEIPMWNMDIGYGADGRRGAP